MRQGQGYERGARAHSPPGGALRRAAAGRGYAQGTYARAGTTFVGGGERVGHLVEDYTVRVVTTVCSGVARALRCEISGCGT
jgi:hypothetical protein